jgi:hypothetical protein
LRVDVAGFDRWQMKYTSTADEFAAAAAGLTPANAVHILAPEPEEPLDG